MLSADAPIGVMDAGFGGYTVIRELQKLLPCENIVFFGDGKISPTETAAEKKSSA